MRLADSLWIDLVGQARGDCWWLVAEVYARRGTTLVGFAADRYDDWQTVETPEPGDVLLSDGVHVGIVIGDGEYLHATDAGLVVVGRIRSLVRAGRPVRYLRHAGTAPVSVAPTPAAGRVRVVYVPDPVGRPTERTTVFRDAGTLGALAPAGANVVMTARGPRKLAEVADEPAPDVVLYATLPAGTELVLALIGLALSVGSAVIGILTAPKAPEARDDQSSPTFDLDGIRNTATSGVVQPVVYGAHRAAGNFISAVQRVDADGRAVFYGLLLLSRGPVQSIGGLTADFDELSGPSIPSSIKIDGNPASSYDCKISGRLGGSEQNIVPGFNETATTVSYANELLQSAPFTHATTQNVTGFDLLVTYPSGLIEYDDDPPNAGYAISVAFTVRWRVTGTTTWTSETWTHTAANSAQISFQFSKRGLTSDRYEVQIERTTAAAPFTRQLSASYMLAVNEVVAQGFSCPGCALLGVRLVGSDQLAGGIPTTTAQVEGRKVYIWDGVSTTSPAFVETYTRNPAWIIFDLLTNVDYGLGRGGRLKLDAIHLEDFEAFADWCDELVDDGRSGTVARAQCDHVADVERSGWELAVEIAYAAWGRLYFAGGKARIWIDKAASPVFLFTNGNTREMRVSYLGRRTRSNAAEVQFLNAETDYERDVATKLDDSAVLASAEAIRKASVAGTGITRAAQAYRLAQREVNAARYVSRRFEWISGPESIHLLPGNVVYLHASAFGVGLGGRVLSATSSTVKLDRSVTASARARLVVTLQDDTMATVYVAAGTYARNAAISIVDAAGAGTTWTTTPTAGSKWVIASTSDQSVTPVAARIESVAMTQQQDVTFEASLYDARTYDDDPGDVEEFTDQLPDPRTMPASVTGLRVTEYALTSCDGTVCDALRVEFQSINAWDAAEVWYRYAGGSAFDVAWTFHAWSRGTAVIPAGCGPWEVAVAAKSAAGTRQRLADAAKASVYVRGRRAAPTAPTSVVATVTAGGILHVTVDGPEGAEYQIRYGSAWAGSILVAERSGPKWSGACPFAGSETLRVRTRSRVGVVSDDEVTAVVAWVTADSVFTADVDNDENPGWAGTLVDTTTSGSELYLDGSALSGTYETDLLAPADTAANQQIVLTARCGLSPVEMLSEEATHLAGSEWASDTVLSGVYLTGRDLTEHGTVANAMYRVDSMPADVYTVAGPPDVVAALTPTVAYDIDEAGTWPTYETPPVSNGIATIAARITLRRPHDRYEPKVSTLNVATFDLSDAGGGGGSGGPWDLGSVADAVDGIFDFGSV